VSATGWDEVLDDCLEFEAWDYIPAERRRVIDGERQVLGRTFLGAPVWVPHMGA